MIGNFIKFQKFSPRIINSREFPPGIFDVADSREIPGIPEREFPVALSSIITFTVGLMIIVCMQHAGHKAILLVRYKLRIN